MNQQTEITTLHRKAGAGRAPSDSVGMTPLKSLRLALSKAAQGELALAVQALDLSEQLLDQTGVLAAVSQDNLLLLLQGPAGSLGLGVIDIQVLAAVIEVQTMGKVSASKAADRRPTNTDCAMIQPVLNAVLSEFSSYLQGSTAESWATGFEVGEHVKSLRLLGLRLEDIQYRMFCATLNLADGAKQGKIQIVLPAAGNCGAGSGGAGAASWASDLRQTVCASHGEIRAILHRTMVPLNQARDFKVGDLVPVPLSAISEIMMEGVDGCCVGRARLGQQNGFRALRIMDPAENAPAKTAVPNLINTAQMPSQPEPVAADPLQAETQFPENDLADPAMDSLPDLPMKDLPDLPDLPSVDLEMPPMAAMPMDMAIDPD